MVDLSEEKKHGNSFTIAQRYFTLTTPNPYSTMKHCERWFGIDYVIPVRWLLAGGLFLAPLTSPLAGQPAPAATAEEEQIEELSPFTVEGTQDSGYMATTTLAGTRLRTELSDVGTAISVLTEEFLQDIAATDNQSALTYATNTEVWGLAGNYQNAPNTGSWGQTAETNQHFNPNTQTRVRGLTGADNTRNYFRTNVAWDSYNVGRIDLLRGQNSILFGLGSPGGVVNATTDSANLLRNSGQAGVVVDEFGTVRLTAEYNQVIARDEFGVRVALLSDEEKYKQEPAYDDERRGYVAARYKPKWLNRNGTTFEISVDFEKGEGTSNRPRTAPPMDMITPFVEPISSLPITLPAGSNFKTYTDGVIPAFTQYANQAGVTFLQDVARTFNPAYVVHADAFGMRLNVDTLENGGTDFWRVGRVWATGARNSNGTIYTGNPQSNSVIWGYGNGFQDVMVDRFNTYIARTGHPFGNAFLPGQITDPTVFDFYEKLIDGPNKEEWNDFDQLRLVLSNTFFQGKLGYELSYFKEDVTRGQTTFLSNVARIFVDLHTETIEGTPNPNFGRPFVQETTFGGNRLLTSEIEGYRGSAYFEHDFAMGEGNDSWWRKVLGRHIFNGAVQGDRTWSDNRNFLRHVYGPDLLALSGTGLQLFSNPNRVSVRYYVGDSLVGRTSMAGANINNLERYVIPPGGTINARYFNTAWNAPTVAYNAAWTNPQGQARTQSTNRANYVGWQNGNFTIIDALSGSQEDFDYATSSASLAENTVDSLVLTWQGYLFKGLLVGTVGWRKDESESASYRSVIIDPVFNRANVDPSVYNLENPGSGTDPGVIRDELTVESKNYSAVAHLNKLKWVGDKLPINISLSYNKGENFNPTSGRRDVNGNFLAAPQGETEEYGILLSTKDGKYTLRVLDYETKVLNTTSVQIPNANFRFNQFLTLNPRELINEIESGVFRTDWEANTVRTWSIDDQENIYGPAWRQFERDFAAAFPGFIDSWLTTGTWAPMDVNANLAAAFVNTEDNVSTGYEIEFTANPTRSLRLTFNASKTEAVRTNVPGDSTRAVYEFLQNAMFNPDGSKTAAGMMRSGYDTLNDTMADFWLEENWIQYQVTQQLNGQKAGELVEWRFNGLVNYTFNEGWLKDFSLGGAVRWESGVTIGYPYMFDEFGSPAADITRPIESDANDRYDLHFRYRRSFFEKKVDWTIQLNLQNVFGEDELIAVRGNPDGTPANFRIQLGQSWRLTNTFSF